MVNPNTAKVGRVHDWEQERTDALVARGRAADKAAYREFRSIAAELAGPNELLLRLIAARLTDAYRKGRSQEQSDDFYFRFGWLEEWTPPND